MVSAAIRDAVPVQSASEFPDTRLSIHRRGAGSIPFRGGGAVFRLALPVVDEPTCVDGRILTAEEVTAQSLSGEDVAVLLTREAVWVKWLAAEEHRRSPTNGHADGYRQPAGSKPIGNQHERQRPRSVNQAGSEPLSHAATGTCQDDHRDEPRKDSPRDVQ